MLGMHGTVYSNYAINEADLLLAFGVRFDDRVTGKVTRVRQARQDRPHRHRPVGDQQEQGRPRARSTATCGRRWKTCASCSDEDANADLVAGGRFADWLRQIEQWRETEPLHFPDRDDAILPQYAIQRLWQILQRPRPARRDDRDAPASASTRCGRRSTSAFNRPRHWVTTGGLGTMGFGLPAAMGARRPTRSKLCIDIDGDGSFLMNIQELACCFTEKMPVKVLLLNNQHLGMVVQWEDRFFGGNRGHTYLGAGHGRGAVPGLRDDGQGVRRARAGVIADKDDLDAALEEMLDSDGPFVLDVMVPYQEHVLPMIPAGMTVRDIIKA